MVDGLVDGVKFRCQDVCLWWKTPRPAEGCGRVVEGCGSGGWGWRVRAICVQLDVMLEQCLIPLEEEYGCQFAGRVSVGEAGKV